MAAVRGATIGGTMRALVRHLALGVVTLGLVTAGAPGAVQAATSTASTGPTVQHAGATVQPAGTARRAVTPPSGTLMVGDSTTWRIAPVLHELVPDWYIDAHRGRVVNALGHRIERYLRLNPAPADFVMALGTNRCHDPEWSEARLRRAIGLLPSTTHVFLVMVVRAGAFQEWKDATLRLYDRYSRDLARTRPHTYIIPWRQTVLSDPTLNPVTGRSSLLEDGTHETGGPRGSRRGPGVETYIHLVLSKWRQVNGVDPT